MRIFTLLIFVLICTLVKSQTCTPPPFVKFVYTIAENGYTVNFVGESCDPTLVYQWDFDDGTISTYAQNEHTPVHTYASAGTYLVRLTVKNPCNQTYTQEATIVIQAGGPSNMWLTLTGPTLAFECQDLSYTAQVTGGVQPIKYEWNFGSHYCQGTNCLNCQGSSGYTLGQSAMTARFSETGIGCNTIWVKVTDALGNFEEKSLCLKVKPGLSNVEIRHDAEPATCGGHYTSGTQILFYPDIDPIYSFDYPTNYLWDFGDGTTYFDNYDGGGRITHVYETCGTKPVKLTISDPNGTFQTSTEVVICGCQGGNTNTACFLNINSSPNSKTIVLDYSNQSQYASSADISLQNVPGCFGLPNIKWTAILNNPDDGIENNDAILFYQKDKICGADIGATMPVWLLPGNCWNSLLSSVPGLEGRKPWGCVGLSAVANCGTPPSNCAAVSECVVYLQPDEFNFERIEVSGTCRNYKLRANATGGGWKKTIQGFSRVQAQKRQHHPATQKA